MLMKYFIFGSKYRKEIPMFCSFKNYLLARINIEREIATSKNKRAQRALERSPETEDF